MCARLSTLFRLVNCCKTRAELSQRRSAASQHLDAPASPFTQPGAVGLLYVFLHLCVYLQALALSQCLPVLNIKSENVCFV